MRLAVVCSTQRETDQSHWDSVDYDTEFTDCWTVLLVFFLIYCSNQELDLCQAVKGLVYCSLRASEAERGLVGLFFRFKQLRHLLGEVLKPPFNLACPCSGDSDLQPSQQVPPWRGVAEGLRQDCSSARELRRAAASAGLSRELRCWKRISFLPGRLFRIHLTVMGKWHWQNKFEPQTEKSYL